MLEVMLTVTFLKIVLLVSGLGGVALLPLFLGIKSSRRENREFIDRLYGGYYREIDFPRHLTRVSE